LPHFFKIAYKAHSIFTVHSTNYKLLCNYMPKTLSRVSVDCRLVVVLVKLVCWGASE